MTAHYTSKHGLVSKNPEELFMVFTDMRNFARMAPSQDKIELQADFDTLTATVQGFKIGIRVDDRRPYELIRIGSADSPVEFVAVLHFDRPAIPGKTDFYIELDANLNFMMKTMLGSRIQQGLDKAVDTLVDISDGKMPQMPSDLM